MSIWRASVAGHPKRAVAGNRDFRRLKQRLDSRRDIPVLQVVAVIGVDPFLGAFGRHIDILRGAAFCANDDDPRDGDRTDKRLNGLDPENEGGG